MKFFKTKQFFRFLKNKTSFNLIYKTQINRIKSFCLDTLEKRSYLALKSSVTSVGGMSILNSDSGLSFTFLSKLAKMELLDIAGF